LAGSATAAKKGRSTLEIILLIYLSRRIAAIVRYKGYQGAWFVVLLIGLWVGGEFGGAVFGAVVSMTANPGQQPALLAIYGFALVGAVLGAIVAFQIAKRVPDKTQALSFDEEAHDQEPPR
jgi:hypothetical protein